MSTQEHYHETAEQHDSFFAVMNSVHFPVVQEALQLTPDDVLLDIGGGTGWYAHQLWKSADLKEPAVCVDLSAEMLQFAKQREGVTTVHSTAEEFFSQPIEKRFTKAMIIEALHHFSDPTAVLKGMWDCLKPDGSLVILETHADPDVPLFRAAEAVNATHEFMSKDELTSLIKASAPFEVHSKVAKVQVKVPKADWYSMLRGRYFFKLHLLSDQEIEDGIAELERERFGSLQDDDPISNTDTILLAVARKDQ